ncbi:unnamed protein product [Amoebophrya sp. A25]|nr:unnamed protein product [Amoebophrya sp. A25]|eukprot:GSA25T00014041001.1
MRLLCSRSLVLCLGLVARLFPLLDVLHDLGVVDAQCRPTDSNNNSGDQNKFEDAEEDFALPESSSANQPRPPPPGEDESITQVLFHQENAYLYRDPATNMQYMRADDYLKMDETSLLSEKYRARLDFTNWREMSTYDQELWTTHAKRSFQHIYSTGKWGFGREADEWDELHSHEWEWDAEEQRHRRNKQMYARHATSGSDPMRRMGTAGSGSVVEHTEGLRRTLSNLILELNLNKMFDFACGDMMWAAELVKSVNANHQETGRGPFHYIGMEIAPYEARRHEKRFKDDPLVHVINGDFSNFRFWRNFSDIAYSEIDSRSSYQVESEAQRAHQEGSLLFIRDALQHVSMAQSCKFFHNVYRFRRNLYPGVRYLLLGGYDTGQPNERAVPTPGACENNPTTWPYRLPGFIRHFPEEDRPETLETRFPNDAEGKIVERILHKRLFLYDIAMWGAKTNSTTGTKTSREPTGWSTTASNVSPAAYLDEEDSFLQAEGVVEGIQSERDGSQGGRIPAMPPVVVAKKFRNINDGTLAEFDPCLV